MQELSISSRKPREIGNQKSEQINFLPNILRLTEQTSVDQSQGSFSFQGPRALKSHLSSGSLISTKARDWCHPPNWILLCCTCAYPTLSVLVQFYLSMSTFLTPCPEHNYSILANMHYIITLWTDISFLPRQYTGGIKVQVLCVFNVLFLTCIWRVGAKSQKLERIHLELNFFKSTSNNNYAVFKKVTVVLDKEIKRSKANIKMPK